MCWKNSQLLQFRQCQKARIMTAHINRHKILQEIGLIFHRSASEHKEGNEKDRKLFTVSLALTHAHTHAHTNTNEC